MAIVRLAQRRDARAFFVRWIRRSLIRAASRACRRAASYSELTDSCRKSRTVLLRRAAWDTRNRAAKCAPAQGDGGRNTPHGVPVWRHWTSAPATAFARSSCAPGGCPVGRLAPQLEDRAQARPDGNDARRRSQRRRLQAGVMPRPGYLAARYFLTTK